MFCYCNRTKKPNYDKNACFLATRGVRASGKKMEHKKYLLSDEASKMSDEEKDRYIQHIREHNLFRSL